MRANATEFAAAAARQLSKAEAYVFLQQKIFPALNRQPASLENAAALAACLEKHKPTASRPDQTARVPSLRFRTD